VRPRLPGVVVCVLLAACCLTFSPAPAAAFPASWPQEYLDALADTSKDATPDKVSRDLIAILPGEPLLRWDASGEQVLVATWADSTYYPKFPIGTVLTVSAAHLIWIAIPDELKNWVASTSFPAENLALRMKQLNGLPPEATKTLYVEFWAKPADLFRPSPDPEITDYEALMDFPDNAFVSVDPLYLTWFNDLRAISYTSETAHPWSRLGYTYDWGNTYDHFGVSEYVISGGAQVEIASMQTTEEYLPLSPTVIDFGRGSATTGDHVLVSACATIPPPAEPAESHPVRGTHCDVYILLTPPQGEDMSLLPDGRLVDKYIPFATASRTGERFCETILDYAVEAGLTKGEWTATVAVLPEGAPPLPGHVLSYAQATLVVY
jgi:hypothetical protein